MSIHGGADRGNGATRYEQLLPCCKKNVIPDTGVLVPPINMRCSAAASKVSLFDMFSA